HTFFYTLSLHDALPIFRQFKERIDEYSGQDHQQKSLLYPGSDIPLPSAGDNLSKIMNQRKSVREFSGREISHQKLGRLFSGERLDRKSTRLNSSHLVIS